MGFGGKFKDVFSNNSPYDNSSGGSIPQDGSVFCTECGTRNIPGARFCKKCGKELMIRPQFQMEHSGTAADRVDSYYQNAPVHDSFAKPAGEDYPMHMDSSWQDQAESVPDPVPALSSQPEFDEQDFLMQREPVRLFQEPESEETDILVSHNGEETDDEEVTVMIKPRIERTVIFTDADSGNIIARIDADTTPNISVGRSRHRDNQVILDRDPTVSRVHCYFQVDSENRIWVTDNQSSNHTYVDDVLVEQKTQVFKDSIVKLGATSVQVEYVEQEL